MALALYSDRYWFPSGVLASSVPAKIFPIDSNGLAPLWADAAGTIPLTNPVNTDGSGVLTFYATVGQYWVHIDTESFLVDVGLSEEQADLSTGVASGGNMDPDLGNPQAVHIDPLVGYVVDNTGSASVPPSVTRVDYPGATVALDAGALGRTLTYWLMDSAQNVIQQPGYPTPEQFRQYLVLGVTVYDTIGGTVIEAQTLPTILAQPANQTVDLMNALGPFSLDGNDISPLPGLQFSKTAGHLFARAFGYFDSGVYTDNPHVSVSPAQSPVTMRLVTQTAAVSTPPAVTSLDPAHYDVGGVVTPIPGGPEVSSIQRVYLFATNVPTLQVVVQYGQVVYETLASAVGSIGSGNEFIPAPVTRLGALIGYIAVASGASDLSDPSQATFVHAGKFSTP